MKFRFYGFCFLNLKVDFLGVVGTNHDVAHGKEVKDVWGSLMTPGTEID